MLVCLFAFLTLGLALSGLALVGARRGGAFAEAGLAAGGLALGVGALVGMLPVGPRGTALAPWAALGALGVAAVLVGVASRRCFRKAATLPEETRSGSPVERAGFAAAGATIVFGALGLLVMTANGMGLRAAIIEREGGAVVPPAEFRNARPGAPR
jgi:hypothetical protein